MCDPLSPSCYEPGSIAPEFIKEVEDKLSRRLGQRVSLVLGDGIIAMKADSVLPTGASTMVMSAGPLLRRRRASEWVDALEKKISRLRGRAQDVEDLFAEIQRSPGPEETGAIVLGHVGDYDDEFFEALAQAIAHEQAELRLAGPAASKCSGIICARYADEPTMARQAKCGESLSRARHAREIFSAAKANSAGCGVRHLSSAHRSVTF